MCLKSSGSANACDVIATRTTWTNLPDCTRKSREVERPRLVCEQLKCARVQAHRMCGTFLPAAEITHMVHAGVAGLAVGVVRCKATG